MLPLLTPRRRRHAPWVQPGELAFIPPADLLRLSSDVSLRRPAYRLHKTLDASNCYATVAPDVTVFKRTPKNAVGPVFSFEIKPKRGFCSERHLAFKVELNSVKLCRVQ
jgi:hypothetical protein